MKTTMRGMDSNLLTSKFRGALQGVLLGDCCGSPFEGTSMGAGSKLVLRRYFDKLEGPFFTAPQKQYTDDTAMTISVARTLIDHKKIDQTDLAKNFVREYYISPRRGYSQSIGTIFSKLKLAKFTDVLTPAQEHFNGMGSYGNGAAMRVTPVALFYANQPSKLLEMVKQQSEITHSHKLGINGAYLQALAVHQSLHLDPTKPVNPKKFISGLLTQMKDVEQDDDGLGIENIENYQRKLHNIIQLLEMFEMPSEEMVLNKLGHSVAALYSVPTAIYCFLKAQSNIPDIHTNNPMRRCLEFAISLGGDTDTITSMAAAITGALYGDSVVPPNLLKHCEAYKEITNMADQLLDASNKD